MSVKGSKLKRSNTTEPNLGLISEARKQFHAELIAGPLTQDSGGVISIADKDNRLSVGISAAICRQLGSLRISTGKVGQTKGDEFEKAVERFLQRTFGKAADLRPGNWRIERAPGAITRFEQYSHLRELVALVKEHPEIEASIGGDYLVKPDIIVSRLPEPDETLNRAMKWVDVSQPKYSPLRLENNSSPLLHASISCKWTIRSDRSQNARTEALNLIRNRKGRVPHAVLVTAEPLPSRLSSIALGTGDLDCVYHFALPELIKANEEFSQDGHLDVLIKGKRIRDIGDLPLDLAS